MKSSRETAVAAANSYGAALSSVAGAEALIDNSVLGSLLRASCPSTSVSFSRTVFAKAMTQLGLRRAFEKEIKAHLEPAMGLALRLTGNADVAEELVQETMLRAVKHWESFRQQSQFKTWLYRILINAFRDRLRKKSVLDLAETNAQACRSSEPSVQAKLEAQELSERVSKLVRGLPERQRDVLILSTYESLSAPEIAETLGIAVANVHANLSLARKRLKQDLARYLDP